MGKIYSVGMTKNRFDVAPEHGRTPFYVDARIWADEQDGPDIYEILFRPKVDNRLNELNKAYWLYNNSKR